MKKKIPDRRSAIEGEAFVLNKCVKLVEPKSPGERGHWVCITCGVNLPHNFAKDSHCAGERGPNPSKLVLRPGDAPDSTQHELSARHVLAWYNYATDKIEVP